MNGIVVGLGIALFCGAIGAALIWDSRRSHQPWIHLKSEFGLVPLMFVVAAGVGLIVAVVSAIVAVT